MDDLEDRSIPGVRVRVTSDESFCEVTLAGFAGSVRIDANTLQIEGRGPGGGPAGLIAQFFEFQRRFGTGRPEALGAG